MKNQSEEPKVVADENIGEAAGDTWARVELFRHQYGELPKQNDDRPINIVEAAACAAKAIRGGGVSPYNAAMIIAYLGKTLGNVLTANQHTVAGVAIEGLERIAFKQAFPPGRMIARETLMRIQRMKVE